jgi:hypothetical protein
VQRKYENTHHNIIFFIFFRTHLTPVVCHAVRRLFLKLYIHVSGITVLIIFEELLTSIGVLVSSGVDHDRAPDNFQGK